MRVAVAGGTGVLGTAVVEALRADGHEPVVLARATGVDLLSGDGLAARLEGVEAVVDATSVGTTRASVATEFFTTVTRTLQEAGAAAGVGHHVVASIVGIDDCPFGYYVGKVAHERAVEDGPVPHTIVRITQFHEFADQVLGQAVGPVAVVPVMRSAPVAVREAGAVVAGLAVGAPQGRAGEVGGPGEESVPDMARRLLRARGSRRRVVPLPVPGRAGRAMRSGALVPTDPAYVGTETFDAWLARQA